MKNLIHIFYLFVIALFWSFYLFVSCGTPKQVITNAGVMQYAIDTVVTIDFIDSVCSVDTINKYPVGWIYTPTIDYTTGHDISSRVYYKDWQQSTYRVIPIEDKKYRFTKRIVK